MTSAEKKAIYAALAKPFDEHCIQRTEGRLPGRGYDTTGIGYPHIANRLNDVLGVGGWRAHRTATVKEITRSNGRPAFEAICDITLELGEWIDGNFIVFAKSLADGGLRLAAKSVNDHLAILRALLNLAVEWGELAFAPKLKQLKVQHKDIQFLSFEETERFVRVAATEWKAFVVTALKTGLRVGELLALKWEDLDLVAGRLLVRRTLWHDQEGTPKGGQTREVPLSNEAIATLKAHRHLKGDYVFCETNGKRLTHSRVKSVVPSTCKKAGLAKRLTTHDLRHTFASHLLMRGVALKAVQELLGHATMEMTMRYAHLSPEVKREAVQVLDRPVPGNFGAHVGHMEG